MDRLTNRHGKANRQILLKFTSKNTYKQEYEEDKAEGEIALVRSERQTGEENKKKKYCFVSPICLSVSEKCLSTNLMTSACRRHCIQDL
jgi:hypothetical protein